VQQIVDVLVPHEEYISGCSIDEAMALRHLDCVDRVPGILLFKKALLEILDAVVQIHYRSTRIGEHLLCQHRLTRYVQGEITGLFSHAVLSPEYLPRRWLARSLLALAMLSALLLLVDMSCGFQLLLDRAADFNCSSTALWSVVGLKTLAGLGCVVAASPGGVS
jgi:hypothetical protein